jgi:hypothetical protein
MDAITVYPATAQKFSLLKTLLEEMKMRFSITREAVRDDSLFTEEAYYAMLDKRIKSAEQGNYTSISGKQELHQFLERL